MRFPASVAGVRGELRPSNDAESGRFTLTAGGVTRPVDGPEDWVEGAELGAEVSVDYGGFTLTVRRAPKGKRYRASALGVRGEERVDEELALWSLLEALGEERAPRACFFCKWADVEAGGGWGNYGCFVEASAAYEKYCAGESGAALKWVTSLGPRWIDPWESCDRFRLRPVGFGYRVRPEKP